MNINDQMSELAAMGSREYTPSDDLVASLVAKTRRARVTRQSATAVAGAVSAIAVGAVGLQVYSAAKDDPAFRDRNMINNKDGLTPIEIYRARFGGENPTRDYESTDLSDIINRLREAAISPEKPTTVLPASGDSTPPPQSTQPATPATPTTPATQKPGAAELLAQCKADHPDQAYKTYNCTTGAWVIKDGYYKDPESGTYYACDGQPDYTGYYYSCASAEYLPESGWFWFGNDHFYQNIQWTDAATGAVSWGNWSGTSWGWDRKAVLTSGPTDPDYDSYVYMGSNATWSGSTCSGVTSTKWGAQVKASCLPEGKVAATGKTYKMNDGYAWVLVNQSLTWHDCLGIFADPANPPEGWEWDGSRWVEVTPPTT